MDVLVVTPFFPHDKARPYAGLFVGEQVHMLQRIEIQVHVVTFVPWTPWPVPALKRKWKQFSQIPRAYSWRGISVEVYRYPVLPRNLSQGTASWAMGRILRRQCARSKPDLIHAHFAYPTGLAAVRSGRRLGVPVVLTVHGSDIHTLPHLARRYKRGAVEALSGATQVLAVSGFMKAAVLQLCPTANVMVHRIGIDLSRFSMEERASVGSTTTPELNDIGGPIILYVGNLLEEKGVIDLLEAFQMVKDLGAHLIYVGDGPLAEGLALRADGLGLGGRVRLLGARPPESIPELLSTADILVLPSHREGLPMVCVEALACGIPVVATNTGGIPEVVRHMETGLLVPPGDIGALAAALRWVLVNGAAVHKLAQAGRRLVEQKYDLEANTRQLREIYQDVL